MGWAEESYRLWKTVCKTPCQKHEYHIRALWLGWWITSMAKQTAKLHYLVKRDKDALEQLMFQIHRNPCSGFQASLRQEWKEVDVKGNPSSGFRERWWTSTYFANLLASQSRIILMISICMSLTVQLQLLTCITLQCAASSLCFILPLPVPFPSLLIYSSINKKAIKVHQEVSHSTFLTFK